MLKSQIGLGILSLPSILGTLGLGTGLICIVGIGIIMTCELMPSMHEAKKLTSGADWMIGETKRKYPQVCESTFHPDAVASVLTRQTRLTTWGT